MLGWLSTPLSMQRCGRREGKRDWRTRLKEVLFTAEVFIPCVFRFLCFPPPRSTETNGPTSVLMWRQESSEERRMVVVGGGVRCGGSWSLTLAGSGASRKSIYEGDGWHRASLLLSCAQ
ncbi:hypothetical protein D4764_22G0002340 [Takifugu flavidus]|uniref:Uncharacterized protein n=1 Tax=Takifugu flavidus TaxID=433684 RepID=A0A5C6NGB6_9TELE|nr:hypothetical protein D4764_22G0002340 [Takifugu flavidus]